MSVARWLAALAAGVAALAAMPSGQTPPGQTPPGQARSAQAPSGQLPPFRLYVLDGGVLESDPARYQLTAADVGTTQLSVAAYLIVHPGGVLLWDTGAITDADWTPGGKPQEQHLTLPDGQERRVTVVTPLLAQLAAAGFSPAQITYLALSHYHWDHTGNANAFAGATWLARPAERDMMFGAVPAPTSRPATFAALRGSRTVMATASEHDVFGDGAVVMKLAAGHTEGHQVLYVKLPRTGAVLLSGDLYHYRQERTLGRFPTFERDLEQTRRARADVEAFLTQRKATLWIQHDLAAHRALRKAPAYYE